MPGYRHTSVVVIGSFNPAIFQPEWFRSNDLLPASEIDFTTVEFPHGSGVQRRPQRVLVANDAAIVEFESLQLQVVQNRWMLVTERADWQGDLGKIAHDVFALLPHTPVRIVGFNVVVHAAPKRPASEVLGRLLPLDELGSIAGDNAMAADFGASVAFQAALELVLEGRVQPSGYTEPVLHRRRQELKAKRAGRPGGAA